MKYPAPMELKRTDSITMVPISIWSLLEVVGTHGLRYRLRERHRGLWLRPLAHPACPVLARAETRERRSDTEGRRAEAGSWTHRPPESRPWCAQQQHPAKDSSQPASAVPHEVCSCLPAVPMVVMMSPVSMRVPVVSSMVVSALSVSVVSPTHDHGRWDDHDRGRNHNDGDRSHDDRHADAHRNIDPGVGGQGQREAREPQDRDDTPPLQDRVETFHSHTLPVMSRCGFA